MSPEKVDALAKRFDETFPAKRYRDDDGDWHEYSLGLDRNAAVEFIIKEVDRLVGENTL